MRIRTIIKDMPTTIRGFTLRYFDEDEEYIIFLNARLTTAQNKATYRHELTHIQSHDFDSDINVNILEAIRHENT